MGGETRVGISGCNTDCDVELEPTDDGETASLCFICLEGKKKILVVSMRW